jgi:hypothetical protein
MPKFTGQAKSIAISLEKSYEYSSFEVLDILFRGLKASPVAWTSFMEV